MRIEKCGPEILFTSNANAAAKSPNAQGRDLIVRAVCDYDKDVYMPLNAELAKGPQSLGMTPPTFPEQLVPTM